MNKEIQAYNKALPKDAKEMCDFLWEEINKNLPHAENKMWHGSPVWFLDGNPIVAYIKLKNFVSLMFWSGQSFDEPKLVIKGSTKFKAAEAQYKSMDDIDTKDIKRWLKKAEEIQYDYKNIIKNKGVLHRIK